jgi:hypothetical protein
MHDGERIGRGVRGAQQPAHRGGRAGQPLRAPRRLRRGQLPLEQLADDPEGEAGLQLGAGAAQHPPAASGGSFATQPEQRRLADAGAAFDDQDTASVQHGVEGPQLVSPFQQHASTVRRRSAADQAQGQGGAGADGAAGVAVQDRGYRPGVDDRVAPLV